MKKSNIIPTKKLSRFELMDVFANPDKYTDVLRKGVTFAKIVYFTDEHGSITVNKQKQLQKRTSTQITLGSSYQNRINKDLERRGEEANFTAQAMYGKTRLNQYFVQADKSKEIMLCCVVEHHVKPNTIFFHQNQPIKKSVAIEKGLFMPSYFTPKKTAGRGNMSEEKDFHFFTLGVEKIIEIVLGGVKYIIED